MKCYLPPEKRPATVRTQIRPHPQSHQRPMKRSCSFTRVPLSLSPAQMALFTCTRTPTTPSTNWTSMQSPPVFPPPDNLPPPPQTQALIIPMKKSNYSPDKVEVYPVILVLAYIPVHNTVHACVHRVLSHYVCIYRSGIAVVI